MKPKAEVESDLRRRLQELRQERKVSEDAKRKKNWDGVDPKVVEKIEELEEHKEYIKNEQADLKDKKESILLKQRQQLIASTNYMTQKVDKIIDKEKEKLLDVFEEQLNISRKSITPSNSFFTNSRLQRSSSFGLDASQQNSRSLINQQQHSQQQLKSKQKNTSISGQDSYLNKSKLLNDQDNYITGIPLQQPFSPSHFQNYHSNEYLNNQGIDYSDLKPNKIGEISAFSQQYSQNTDTIRHSSSKNYQNNNTSWNKTSRDKKTHSLSNKVEAETLRHKWTAGKEPEDILSFRNQENNYLKQNVYHSQEDQGEINLTAPSLNNGQDHNSSQSLGHFSSLQSKYYNINNNTSRNNCQIDSALKPVEVNKSPQSKPQTNFFNNLYHESLVTSLNSQGYMSQFNKLYFSQKEDINRSPLQFRISDKKRMIEESERSAFGLKNQSISSIKNFQHQKNAHLKALKDDNYLNYQLRKNRIFHSTQQQNNKLKKKVQMLEKANCELKQQNQKYKNTVAVYEKELDSLFESIYQNEKELKQLRKAQKKSTKYFEELEEQEIKIKQTFNNFKSSMESTLLDYTGQLEQLNSQEQFFLQLSRENIKLKQERDDSLKCLQKFKNN